MGVGARVGPLTVQTLKRCKRTAPTRTMLTRCRWALKMGTTQANSRTNRSWYRTSNRRSSLRRLRRRMALVPPKLHELGRYCPFWHFRLEMPTLLQRCGMVCEY